MMPDHVEENEVLEFSCWRDVVIGHVQFPADMQFVSIAKRGS